MTAAEIERKFPEAVAFARALRDVFGPETKLIYARNAQGESLGRETLRLPAKGFPDPRRNVTAP